MCEIYQPLPLGKGGAKSAVVFSALVAFYFCFFSLPFPNLSEYLILEVGEGANVESARPGEWQKWQGEKQMICCDCSMLIRVVDLFDSVAGNTPTSQKGHLESLVHVGDNSIGVAESTDRVEYPNT